MILTSVSAFEIILILKTKKMYFTMIVFCFIWVIVFLFSVFSTVAGQYNKRVETENLKISENISEIHKETEWNIYNNKEEEINYLIEQKEKELEVVNNIMFQFDTLEKRQENEAEWLSSLTTKRKAEEKIEELRRQLDEVRENKLDFLANNEDTVGVTEDSETVDESFYVWLADIWNLSSPSLVQFWFSMFPAVFIDIIAPLGLAVAMFLRRKEDA